MVGGGRSGLAGSWKRADHTLENLVDYIPVVAGFIDL